MFITMQVRLSVINQLQPLLLALPQVLSSLGLLMQKIQFLFSGAKGFDTVDKHKDTHLQANPYQTPLHKTQSVSFNLIE